MLRKNLRIENCHGQCCDGASSMSEQNTDFAEKIMELEQRALYTHCYGHALNPDNFIITRRTVRAEALTSLS